MFETLMTLIDACGNDADCYEIHGIVYLTLHDFDGFNDDWDEIMRDYDNPNAVNALLDWLDTHCVSQNGNLYTDYFFDGFAVQLGYTSFDI